MKTPFASVTGLISSQEAIKVTGGIKKHGIDYHLVVKGDSYMVLVPENKVPVCLPVVQSLVSSHGTSLSCPQCQSENTSVTAIRYQIELLSYFFGLPLTHFSVRRRCKACGKVW